MLKKFPPMEMPGIEPGAFHMQSECATTALHPLHVDQKKILVIENNIDFFYLPFICTYFHLFNLNVP